MISGRWVATIVAAAMLVLQVIFYPPAISIVDESAYLTFVYVMRAGHVHPDLAHMSLWHGELLGGHVVSVVPPGESLLLLGPSLVNWHLVFVVNLALLTAGFFLFRALLASVSIPRAWAFLYLFYPPLVFYSRTVMSEVASATLMVAALLAYRRGGRATLVAGVLLGLAPWVRYTTLVAVVAVTAVAAVRDLWAWRLQPHPSPRSLLTTSSSARLVAGAALPLAAFAAYSLTVYGRLTPPDYGATNQFSLAYIPAHLPVFLFVSLGMYPLMGLGLVFYRGPLRAEMTVMAVAAAVILSAYFEIENAGSLARNLVVQSRYLVPFAAALLLPYAALLDRVSRRLAPRRAWLAPAALIGLGFAGAVALTVVNQRHLQDTATSRDLITSHLSGACALVAKDAPIFLTPAWTGASWSYFAANDPTVASRTCGTGMKPTSMVYVGHPGDERDLEAVDALADQMGGTAVLDRRTDWLIRVWRLP